MCHGGSGPRGRCRVYWCFPFRGKGIGGQFRGGHRPSGGVCPYVPCQVYVTVNTILKDEELPETERLVWELYRAGVDALIVQDMALLELDLPPIPLHASTQMDNRTPEKVKFLHGLGFSQVVLARELSLAEIQPCMRLATCRWRSLYTGRSVSVTADSATCRSIASGGVPIGESAPSSAG